MAVNIAENLHQIQQKIHEICLAYQREPENVLLLAVSKTKPSEAIRAAYHAGQRHFGENYLQEALQKIEDLQDLAITWHFIGAIQSNKTRAIAEHFDWVHSVDRLKIAQRLSEQRPPQMPPLNICLQLNISHEDSKSGATADEILELANQVSKLPGIKLRGLMALPAKSTDFAQQRQEFAKLAQILLKLQSRYPQPGPQLDTLSMGMSNDMQAAIAEGSTIVRIGTAIFGAREG